ncbi:MAG: hypothetical protein A2063_07275 [Gallionellales bacterium GWA2_60_142]|nr:MAG: hypothetical protein A2063_07275 [Gallionellales bacterium GWA2_60_142]HCI14438.1 hypothetical protein [Gallionellaceae bacterium]
MNQADHPIQSETLFRGLAPFLRISIAGADLRSVGQELLDLANNNADDAHLWMNLSIAMQCLGQRDIGLSIQQQALDMQRIYRIPASEQPAKFRLLMLMAAGDLSANTPLECLLENSDIDLILYYITPGDPLALPIPEHDALLVAISEVELNRDLLESLAQPLAQWPKPVINAPMHILSTERSVASALLQDAPGVLIPPTLHASREVLLDIAAGTASLPELSGGIDFPIILRPHDSQAGRDLDKISSLDEMAAYLARVTGDEEFFLSRFIDYSGADGLFRKFRITVIDGAAFACHMAVSSHWMVHYVNAGMYEDARKREEEAAFMTHFNDFAQRHRVALDAVHRRLGLDYFCIDCAESPDGRLQIFEADHVMVVHAMDPEDMFPYKQIHIRKVQRAFRDYLFRLTATTAEAGR